MVYSSTRGLGNGTDSAHAGLIRLRVVLHRSARRPYVDIQLAAWSRRAVLALGMEEPVRLRGPRVTRRVLSVLSIVSRSLTPPSSSSHRFCTCSTMGPIFIDAGVASYLPALLLALWSNFHSSATPAMLASPLVCSIGAGCAGVILVNFLVPVAKYLKAARGGVPYPFNGFPNLKPGWWAAVFHFYVHSSFALWGTWLVKAVRANAAAEEPQPGLTMAGSVGCVLLFATLLGAFDKHANAPVKKWLKSQGKANP